MPENSTPPAAPATPTPAAPPSGPVLVIPSAPPPAPTVTPLALTPDQAAARQAALQKDPGFMAKWAAGDAAARQEMMDLTAARYPGVAEFDEGGGMRIVDAPSTAEATPNYDIAIPQGATVEQARQVNQQIHEIGQTLKIERETVNAFARELSNANLARAERAMDPREMAEFEGNLRRALGQNYDKHADAVEAALRRLGPRAEWVRRSILQAGPRVATWAWLTLGNAAGGR